MEHLGHHHDRQATDNDGAAPEASTIVGLSFDDPFRAQEFQVAALGLRSKHALELLDVVTIVKDAEGKTRVIETVDPSPAQSAVSGGMWAGLVGLLLGGPIGWAAGVAVGAGVGAVAAKAIDLGLPDDWVKWFREAVQPNTTTVVLLLGATEVEPVLTELKRFAGARLVYANVPPDTVQRIRDAIDDPSSGPLTQADEGDADADADADADGDTIEPPPSGDATVPVEEPPTAPAE